MLDLPKDIAAAMRDVFDALPLDAAMNALVVTAKPASEHVRLVEAAIAALPACEAREPLAAGLWLYVDALDRSHAISQTIETPTGSFWHGIMHRREGDFSNSHYWFRRAGAHPVIAEIAGYDPRTFVYEVESDKHSNSARLVSLQRAEWAALFTWCSKQI